MSEQIQNLEMFPPEGTSGFIGHSYMGTQRDLQNEIVHSKQIPDDDRSLHFYDKKDQEIRFSQEAQRYFQKEGIQIPGGLDLPESSGYSSKDEYESDLQNRHKVKKIVTRGDVNIKGHLTIGDNKPFPDLEVIAGGSITAEDPPQKMLAGGNVTITGSNNPNAPWTPVFKRAIVQTLGNVSAPMTNAIGTKIHSGGHVTLHKLKDTEILAEGDVTIVSKNGATTKRHSSNLHFSHESNISKPIYSRSKISLPVADLESGNAQLSAPQIFATAPDILSNMTTKDYTFVSRGKWGEHVQSVLAAQQTPSEIMGKNNQALQNGAQGKTIH